MKKSQSESEHAVTQLVLYVDEMRGRRAVRDVTSRPRDVSGVEIVTVDLGQSLGRISGSTTVDEVLSAFVGSGYALQLVSPTD